MNEFSVAGILAFVFFFHLDASTCAFVAYSRSRLVVREAGVRFPTASHQRRKKMRGLRFSTWH